MKKILLILIIGIFVFNFVSAEIQSLEPIKLGEEINLIQTCASCTFNNITSVLDPTSFEVIGNFQMTKTGSVYNFTLSSDNITELGKYIVNGIGDLDGTNTIWNYNFEVTPTGKSLDEPQSLIIFGLIIVLVIVTLIFLYFGKVIEYVPFKIFLTSLGGLFLMFTVGFSLNVINNLLIVSSVLSATFVNLYRLMLILISAGGIGLMVYIVYMSVRQFYSNRGLIDGEGDPRR